MANEYNDFAVKMRTFASDKQSLSNNISDLTKKTELFNKKHIKTEDLEHLKQYDHPENLEIHHILFTQSKKSNC